MCSEGTSRLAYRAAPRRRAPTQTMNSKSGFSTIQEDVDPAENRRQQALPPSSWEVVGGRLGEQSIVRELLVRAAQRLFAGHRACVASLPTNETRLMRHHRTHGIAGEETVRRRGLPSRSAFCATAAAARGFAAFAMLPAASMNVDDGDACPGHGEVEPSAGP